jgi:hypothetical protein
MFYVYFINALKLIVDNLNEKFDAAMESKEIAMKLDGIIKRATVAGKLPGVSIVEQGFCFLKKRGPHSNAPITPWTAQELGGEQQSNGACSVTYGMLSAMAGKKKPLMIQLLTWPKVIATSILHPRFAWCASNGT